MSLQSAHNVVQAMSLSLIWCSMSWDVHHGHHGHVVHDEHHGHVVHDEDHGHVVHDEDDLCCHIRMLLPPPRTGSHPVRARADGL